jgi:hypothetical protein
MGPLHGTLKHIELVAESDVLQFQRGARAENGSEYSEQGGQDTHRSDVCGEARNVHYLKQIRICGIHSARCTPDAPSYD